MRIARARRSRGTCSRCSTRRRRCRSSGWCSTRSPRRPSSTPSTTPATSTAASSTRRRPAGCSTASTATARSPAPPARRSGRAPPSGGSRAWPPAWSSTASASGWPSSSAGYWDLDGEFAATATDAAAAGRTVLRLARAARRHAGWPAARTSATTACSATASWRSTSPGPPRWPPRSEPTTCRSGCAASSVSPYRRRPAAPFITSTFQQEAGRKLRLSASMAMRSAQSLYEAGYITYMRTDSTTLSETALDGGPPRDHRALRRPVRARRAPHLRQEGQERAGGPRGHPSRRRLVPLARGRGPRGQRQRRQGLRAHLEAHDRLADDRRHRRDRHRPARAANPTPSARWPWPARAVGTFSWADVEFATSGTIITHQGFRLAYVVDRDEGDDADEQERQLPPLAEGDALVGPRRSRRTATRPSRRPASPRRRW